MKTSMAKLDRKFKLIVAEKIIQSLSKMFERLNQIMDDKCIFEELEILICNELPAINIKNPYRHNITVEPTPQYLANIISEDEIASRLLEEIVYLFMLQ